jgi:hypothetical protein
LRAVLLHELAHFKMGDIPLNWLFAWIRVVHWFNPLGWMAGMAWAEFREEAADESAIRWLAQPSGTVYGESLLRTLGNCQGGTSPCGALAIGESIQNLKRRIKMIHYYTSKSNLGWMAMTVALVLAIFMSLSPSLAGDDTSTAIQKETDAAVQAMQTWLTGIDGGDYSQSWDNASKKFQAAITSDKWVAALKAVRAPLGKMDERKQVSAMYQTGMMGGGSIIPGQYVIAQFDTSFENLKAARETVTFEKEEDGTWRASGYYIKPR